MIQTFDTDTILYGILKAAITSEITGGIYVRQRPDNSDKEDIVVNTIDLTQEFEPQIGTSNINIHVSDITVSVSGKQQEKANLSKLKEISALVFNAVRIAKVEGLILRPQSQTIIQEADINQHYVNIRINWNIH